MSNKKRPAYRDPTYKPPSEKKLIHGINTHVAIILLVKKRREEPVIATGVDYYVVDGKYDIAGAVLQPYLFKL